MNHWRRRVPRLIFVPALAVLLVACGGADTSSTPFTAEAASTPDTAAYDACVAVIAPLLEATRQLDAGVDLGLTSYEYGDALEEISVEHERLDVTAALQDIDPDCLELAAPLEVAFIAYSDAHAAMEDCSRDDACASYGMEALTRDLEAFWATASEKIDEAEAGLRDARP